MDCINTLRPYFLDNQCRICDCTVGGTFIWRDYHNTEYAVEDDVLFLKVMYPDQAFAPPRGEEPDRESYERIVAYCDATGVQARFCSVSETVLQWLLEMFPGSSFQTDRSWSDYLYSARDLAGLEGRRYAGQRNHINRFTRENNTWSYERITSSNIHEIRAFYEKNAAEHLKHSAAYIEGNRKALEVMDNIGTYKLCGGALYVGGEVVGASFGEIVDDTLFVHIEKADTSYHGSYPMLVTQFARMFASDGIKFINREEDDGDEGLRKSKLSYHPIELLHKYSVEVRC